MGAEARATRRPLCGGLDPSRPGSYNLPMPETAPPAPAAIAPARLRFREPAFLISFAAYLAFYQLLCYHGTYTRGDDFAYMESVVESLARGHLFTHDFIGPHNAFLTA